MDLNTALDIIAQLIEQANANGQFKKLVELDTVRKAYAVIYEALNEGENKSVTT